MTALHETVIDVPLFHTTDVSAGEAGRDGDVDDTDADDPEPRKLEPVTLNVYVVDGLSELMSVYGDDVRPVAWPTRVPEPLSHSTVTVDASGALAHDTLALTPSSHVTDTPVGADGTRGGSTLSDAAVALVPAVDATDLTLKVYDVASSPVRLSDVPDAETVVGDSDPEAV